MVTYTYFIYKIILNFYLLHTLFYNINFKTFKYKLKSNGES